MRTLLMFSFLMPFLLIGQEVFYKDSRGNLYDSMTYVKILAAMNEDSKTGPFKSEVTEEFKLISSNSKKKVYSFNWVFKIGGGMSIGADNFFKRGKYQGKVFPLPKVKTIAGKTINLKSLEGKPTLINFWFVACKPCVAEMPSLNKLVEKYKDKVNFVSITYESREAIEAFLKNKTFDFQHIGESSQYLVDLEVNGYPMNLFLDRQGVLIEVRGTMKGIENRRELTENGDLSEFEAILESLLKE